ncbi:MAG: acetyl-CoA carboxylase carboxyltransferase subunit alpha [Planctomycetota bacterium]|nr:acetyl-CoA carboxylase carboxyltransferase subunit alpha [Planctomycetota bacterium]
MAQRAASSSQYLPFEESLREIEEKIGQLNDIQKTHKVDMLLEIESMNTKREKLLEEIYSKLNSWERIQVARHQKRPQTMDYIERLCEDFIELHGDRAFRDDRAIVSGFATIEGRRMMLIGQHKGRDVYERSACNFGSPQPEGYRKALWKMRLAEKYRLPVVCLIDTKGAAPAVEAEERGQSRAIAYNLMVMSGLKVPIVCAVIGEGGSGGALGIGVGDHLMIQEFAYFSVISPEGCASILWKDAAKKEEAARALKITAPELKELGIMDEIVQEPLGGAHRDPEKAAELLKDAIVRNYDALLRLPLDELLERRYRKIRSYGKYRERVLEAVGAS